MSCDHNFEHSFHGLKRTVGPWGGSDSKQFEVVAEGQTCTLCGETRFTDETLLKVDLEVCRNLMREPIFGHGLRFYRRALGHTVADWAILLGSSEEDVRKWERTGDIAPAKYQVMLDILVKH